MKRISKFLALLTLPALLLGFAACGGGNSDPNYTDTVDRPEIETPAALPTVVYPEKPAQKPAAPAAGTAPTVADYTASAAKSTYTVEKTAKGAKISYNNVSDWAYVYVPVSDYSAEYGNVKITLENGENAAERIAVQAVYYEAYELGYAPVTVFLGELTEGEQYVIIELGEHMIIDKNYAPVKDNSVKDKTLLGFVIFIDSLASYKPLNDKAGSLEITNFEMLKDNDPKLADRYVKPVVGFENATADEGVTLTKTETTVGLSGEGTAYMPVTKYSSDYAKVSLTLNGTAQVKVGVRFTFDGATQLLSTEQSVTLTGSAKEVTYDYLEMFAESTNPDISTQYVKNGTVTDIYVTITEGNATVEGATFVRTATGGAYVADAWTDCPNVQVVRAENGGNARIDYKYHSSWDSSISVPVRKGAGVKKLEFKIYAPEGISHFGVGVSTTSNLGSNNQDPGRYILRPSRHMFKLTSSGIQNILSNPEEEPNLNGLKEILDYDAETKIYTITYDFTEMKDTAGNSISDYTISSLLFYFNCPCAGKNQQEHKFDGKRSLYILSIGLFTE